MKKPTINIILICWLGLCIGLPSIAFGYGGGGGGGGGGGSEGTDLFASMGPSYSGGVSWAPNPNGADVMGSSVWDGRPESIHHGPYQPDKAVEDAEAELLQGLQDGNYTPAQVKEQLEWAQRVGIKISPEALQALDKINNPPAVPKPPAKSSQPSSGSSQSARNQKENEGAALAIKIGATLIDLNKKGASASEMELSIILGIIGHQMEKQSTK